MSIEKFVIPGNEVRVGALGVSRTFSGITIPPSTVPVISDETILMRRLLMYEDRRGVTRKRYQKNLHQIRHLHHMLFWVIACAAVHSIAYASLV